MMKKLICIMIAGCLLCPLFACHKDRKESNDAPQYVTDICNQFIQLGETYDLGYTCDGTIRESDSMQKSSYYFSLDAGGNNFSVHFLKNSAGPSRSFRYSRFEESNRARYSIYTSFFMVTDPSLSIEEAKEKAQSLTNLRYYKARSDFIPSGDYYIVVLDDLYAFHKDDLNGDPNVEEFEPVQYDIVNNSILKENLDKKFYLTGTIQYSKEADLSSDTAAITQIQTPDGKEYLLSHNLKSVPTILETGKTYTVYGTVTKKIYDLPTLNVTYIQP